MRQLAQVRATDPQRVAVELARCRASGHGGRLLTGLLADPRHARDTLAARLDDAWSGLIAPSWNRIRTLLERDIARRSRTLARHGLRRVLDQLHAKLRWTSRGLQLADGRDDVVEVDRRGLLLIPSAYLWPHIATIVEPPWQPTIVYPAAGIADLWRAPVRPPDALARLLGNSRAGILAELDRPLSTTALAAITGLSPAGVSAHLRTLRDAGLLSTTRYGHEVLYQRTGLGDALLTSPRDDDIGRGRA
jgi:DNA-binding transcriptional ArsR family regulator